MATQRTTGYFAFGSVNNGIRRGVSAMTLAASLALATASPALAQESGATEPGDESAVVQDIVVTAERRSVNLQDVPISATVLDAELLAKRAVDDVNDLQNVAPSVAINTVNRSTFINIRGVGLFQGSPTSVPGVAFYIDGQLIPHEHLIRLSFFDFGSVEVLRGPQGTLTGQNSTGGAIYIRTPEAEFNRDSGYLDVTVADSERVRVAAAVNGALNENVAVRIAAVHEQSDSFVRNIGPSPSRPGDLNQDGARINLALKSSDDRLRVDVRGEYFDYRSGNSAVKNRNDLVSDDPFVIEEDAISFYNIDGYRASVEARYDVSDTVRLRGLTTKLDANQQDQADGDRTATALPRVPGNPATNGNQGRVARGGTTFSSWTNEFNILSTGDGPFNWIVGAFTFNEDITVFSNRDNFHTVDYVTPTSQLRAAIKNKSYSIFGQANYFVMPKLELLVGARQSWDKQHYERIIVPGCCTPAQRFQTQTSNALTGKLGINFHATDDALIYASVSRGYKAGGVNISPGLVNFQPEKNLVYEGGFKLTLLDRHLRINGAAFYSDYKNIQFISLQNGLQVQQNAGAGEIYGAELEITAQFGGFGFSFGGSYLSSEFAKPACLNNSFNPAGSPGLCPAGNEFIPEGRRLPFAPKYTANAGIEYEIALGGEWTITPRLQWAHTASQESTPFPGPFTSLASRDIVDGRLTLNAGRNYQLEGYVTNLLDETYIASKLGDATSALGGFVYGAPRQFGVRGVVRF